MHKWDEGIDWTKSVREKPADNKCVICSQDLIGEMLCNADKCSDCVTRWHIENYPPPKNYNPNKWTALAKKQKRKTVTNS